MDQKAACEWLGVDPNAPRDDALAAYARMSRPLKRKILDARRTAEMRLYQKELRRLVEARDALVGKTVAPKPVSSYSRLLARLAKVKVLEMDRRDARSFFGLPVYASDAQVLNAYDEAARALVRRLTLCTNDSELKTVNRARNRLRTIREIAMA